MVAVRTMHTSVFGRVGRGVVGQLHANTAVIDTRIAYAGSANFSFNSRGERDIVFRFLGSPVKDVREGLVSYRDGAQKLFFFIQK